MYGSAGSLAVMLCLSLPPAQQDRDARWLVEHDRWKQARHLLEIRHRENPQDPETLYLLSRARQAFRDRDGALALAEKAAALEPRNADYRWQVANLVGEAAQDAHIFRQLGLARRFRREAETVLAIDAGHVQALSGMMVYYLKAPGILGGDKSKAREMADRIMRVDAVHGFFAQVQLAVADKRPDAAEALFLEAVEAERASYEARVSIMNWYAAPQRKRFDEAERHAREAIRIDPDRIGAYATLASILAEQKRWTDLDALIARAEERIPDNLLPYYRAAASLAATGSDPQRAEQYCRKYLSRQPEPTAPGHAAAHWRLAQIFEKQGRRSDALLELRAALELDPKFEPAKKDLKRLS